jgi:hypothetical protein
VSVLRCACGGSGSTSPALVVGDWKSSTFFPPGEAIPASQGFENRRLTGRANWYERRALARGAPWGIRRAGGHRRGAPSRSAVSCPLRATSPLRRRPHPAPFKHAAADMATKTMVAGLNSVTGYANYRAGLSLRSTSLLAACPLSRRPAADIPTLKHENFGAGDSSPRPASFKTRRRRWWS